MSYIFIGIQSALGTCFPIQIRIYALNHTFFESKDCFRTMSYATEIGLINSTNLQRDTV